jgi:hypothetical protein
MLGETSALLKWIETQSPLWVIYALVIIGLIQVGRVLLAWLPTVFEKHCAMLDTATSSMAESATAIAAINIQGRENVRSIAAGHTAIADAAVPACKAILVVTPPDKREEVKGHLDEVVRILTKPTQNKVGIA